MRRTSQMQEYTRKDTHCRSSIFSLMRLRSSSSGMLYSARLASLRLFCAEFALRRPAGRAAVSLPRPVLSAVGAAVPPAFCVPPLPHSPALAPLSFFSFCRIAVPLCSCAYRLRMLIASVLSSSFCATVLSSIDERDSSAFFVCRRRSFRKFCFCSVSVVSCSCRLCERCTHTNIDIYYNS